MTTPQERRIASAMMVAGIRTALLYEAICQGESNPFNDAAFVEEFDRMIAGFQTKAEATTGAQELTLELSRFTASLERLLLAHGQRLGLGKPDPKRVAAARTASSLPTVEVARRVHRLPPIIPLL